MKNYTQNLILFKLRVSTVGSKKPFSEELVCLPVLLMVNFRLNVQARKSYQGMVIFFTVLLQSFNKLEYAKPLPAVLSSSCATEIWDKPNDVNQLLGDTDGLCIDLLNLGYQKLYVYKA